MAVIPILTPMLVCIIIALFGNNMSKNALYSVVLSILSVGLIASWGISTNLFATGEPILLDWLTLIELKIKIGVEWFNVPAFVASIIYTVVFLVIVYSIFDVSFEKNQQQKLSLSCVMLFFVQILFSSSYVGQIVFAWLGIVFCATAFNGLHRKKQDNNILIFLIFNFLSVLLFIASVQIGDILADIEMIAEPNIVKQLIFGVSSSEIIVYFFLVSLAMPMALPPFNVWIENIASASVVLMTLVFGLFTLVYSYILFQVFSMFDISETGRIILASISLIAIVLSAFVAVSQKDIFKCLAYVYSIISATIMLGFAISTAEYVLLFALVQFISVALLFMIFGAVQYSLSGERDMTKMGGLAKKLPGVYFIFFVAVMAVLSIPPFSGFFARAWLFTNIVIENKTVLSIGLVCVLGASFVVATVFGRIWALVFYGAENEDELVQARMVGTDKCVMLCLIVLSIMALGLGLVAEKVFFKFNQPQTTLNLYGISQLLGSAVITICGLVYGFRKVVKNQSNIANLYQNDILKNNFYIYDSLILLLILPIKKITEYIYKIEISGTADLLNKFMLYIARQMSVLFNFIFTRAIVLTAVLLFVTFAIIVLLFALGVK